MNLCFDEEQEAYRTAVRKFADEVLTPIARERYDFTATLTRKQVQAIAAELERYEIATTVPETQQGGIDLIYLGIFIEEVTRVDVAYATLANALFFQVWDMVSLLETDEQKERYGHMFGRGEMVAISISEPEAASNPADMRTRATPAPDGGWTLDGHKMWASHAALAAGIVVAARMESAGDSTGEIALFMVEAETPGLVIEPTETLGMNATTVCELHLRDVHVPACAELTRGRNGLRSALALVEQARLKVVFMAVGLARAALERSISYSKERMQGGRPIASYQLVQEMLAEMSTLVETSRLLGYRAASLMMRGDRAQEEGSRAKGYATESAVRATSLAIQVHGAMGLTRELGVEKLFRDARMLTIPDGTTEIHKLVVGRALTGVNALR
jgi:alkylation response protein AidB-like acyl-CoA dehydrogenase